MSKHTAGPWFITGQMTKYVEARIGGGIIQEVAAVGPTDADGGYGSQQEANARLIAAAPDLLEALEDMLSGWKYIRESYGDLYGVGWDRAQNKALAAIAKAAGDNP